MDNYFLNQKTPNEINMGIAKKIKDIRKHKKLSREKISQKSGVSFGSVKRFESTGEISLMSLTKIAIALGCEDELDNLFSQRSFSSIQEVIDEQD